MKGVAVQIINIHSQVKQMLTKPSQKMDRDLYDTNFIQLSCEALVIAELLISNSNTQIRTCSTFTELVNEIKDAKKRRPQQDSDTSSEDIHKMNDLDTPVSYLSQQQNNRRSNLNKFLSINTSNLTSSNTGEIDWFVNKMQEKQQDTKQFINCIQKLSNNLNENTSASFATDTTQTDISWVNTLEVSQQNNQFFQKLIETSSFRFYKERKKNDKKKKTIQFFEPKRSSKRKQSQAKSQFVQQMRSLKKKESIADYCKSKQKIQQSSLSIRIVTEPGDSHQPYNCSTARIVNPQNKSKRWINQSSFRNIHENQDHSNCDLTVTGKSQITIMEHFKSKKFVDQIMQHEGKRISESKLIKKFSDQENSLLQLDNIKNEFINHNNNVDSKFQIKRIKKRGQVSFCKTNPNENSIDSLDHRKIRRTIDLPTIISKERTPEAEVKKNRRHNKTFITENQMQLQKQIRQLLFKNAPEAMKKLQNNDKLMLQKLKAIGPRNREARIREEYHKLEWLHRKLCGNQCVHLKRFQQFNKYKNWGNRIPLSVATSNFGFS